ncbi:MAG TPA: hypothetical protein VGR01_19710 [Burkholderiales bacterium]|nr:hypothetical protein [Burkholderiales bacterium]
MTSADRLAPRTEAEKLVAEARAKIADFGGVEAVCAIQMARIRVARLEVQKKTGNAKARARALEALDVWESTLVAAAKAAAESRVTITSSILALQASLEGAS